MFKALSKPFKAIIRYVQGVGYEMGECTSRQTSKRSPAFKRECFNQAFQRVQNTDFEGGRPTRRMRRDMAWRKARLMAKEARDKA